MLEIIGNGIPAVQPGSAIAGKRSGPAANPSFATRLQEALQEVNRLQVEADQAALSLAAGGGPEELHHLMITTTKAQLSLQLTVQVVNKILQAYQEISRMQV